MKEKTQATNGRATIAQVCHNISRYIRYFRAFQPSCPVCSFACERLMNYFFLADLNRGNASVSLPSAPL